MSEQHDPTGLELAERVARAIVDGTRYERPQVAEPVRKRRRVGEFVEQRSGAHPDDRDPQLLGSVCTQLISERGWQHRLSLTTVLRNWAALVGEANAQHSKPVDYTDGVLKVRCDSTAWATGMRYSASALVAKLNKELGDRAVIRVDISGPPQKSWNRGPLSVRGGRGPRDTYG
ncbi:DUF721 domain-containing protein [Tessaracoccus sp. OH4464_COT-324]|uniref:DUF721 domain-containing protein n=1 Tax=Tessaracoccus sp. OH4464_COT-324 TaxID=2491059 RepID=UPI000F640440|nr:DciA family protein [Tessaracoccus sp. OH4464_COT-324]RRD46133.1 DUF721 domain-containing protein [Tessaracoccus sp. OH4464_COT-324]